MAELGQEGARPGGIEGSELPGPYPVGEYAARLQDRLRRFARVQVFGEVLNLRAARTKVFFELRDARGALPCSMWRDDFEQLGAAGEALVDGAQVVVGGGCDYYPGSAQSSPSFTFLARDLRVAGDGDLLAQLDRLRKKLAAEGLFEPQKRLRRRALPRTIGVVTGESGKARDDVLAALRRRGWEGRLVWGFAPVQDRRAAGRITRALQDLAAVGGVEAIVVARGGGSLADLFAFCDETLCRTVALLSVPVIASVGHHSDRTLIDDVAAVSCSTPTHAAEEAVPVDCDEARAGAHDAARRLQRHGRRAVLDRARTLAALSRAPAEHVARHRARVHQELRELRATSRRRVAEGRETTSRRLLVLSRVASRAGLAEERERSDLRVRTGQLRRAAEAGLERRARELERLRLAIDTHDPERTLERGYALVEDGDGGLVTSAGGGGGDAGDQRRVRSPRRTGLRPLPGRSCEREDRGMTEDTEQQTYEAAAARIEAIIKRLDSGEAGLRETLDLCGEGRELVDFCATELDAVGRGLEELRLDELVARLEAGPGDAAS